MSIAIAPSTIKEANRIVSAWHRHNRPVHGALFAVAAQVDGRTVGVAIVGRPLGRMAQDGTTCEIVRVATDGTYNACSKLYGACCRAAKALGYRRVITKTLESEAGASLRAAGFEEIGRIEAGLDWDRAGRRRANRDLFGNELAPTEAKRRWERLLCPKSDGSTCRSGGGIVSVPCGNLTREERGE